jgi:hypothetical protein
MYNSYVLQEIPCKGYFKREGQGSGFNIRVAGVRLVLKQSQIASGYGEKEMTKD